VSRTWLSSQRSCLSAAREQISYKSNLQCLFVWNFIARNDQKKIKANICARYFSTKTRNSTESRNRTTWSTDPLKRFFMMFLDLWGFRRRSAKKSEKQRARGKKTASFLTRFHCFVWVQTNDRRIWERACLV